MDYSFLFVILPSCIIPNINDTGEDELKSLELNRKLDKEKMTFENVVYDPIYSDIYIDEGKPKNLLSATLSIRNMSYQDSLFVSKIDFSTPKEILLEVTLKTQSVFHLWGLSAMSWKEKMIWEDLRLISL